VTVLQHIISKVEEFLYMQHVISLL